MKRVECKNGEIWIRFKNKEEYRKAGTDLADILERHNDVYDDRLNTFKVFVFIQDERVRRELLIKCQAGAIEELKNAFGGENIGFVDKGTVNICDREFKDSENIERIADALVGIKGCLERIADCCGCPEPQWFNNLKNADSRNGNEAKAQTGSVDESRIERGRQGTWGSAHCTAGNVRMKGRSDPS